MSTTTAGRTPTARAAAVEQARVVGLAVKWEVLAICALLAFGLVAIPILEMFGAQVEGEPLTALNPADLGYVAMMLALLTPLGVWRGESRFGESPLWTLPVDHARHARMKVAAGWLWLMTVVTVGLLAICGMVLMVEDGTLGLDVTRTLVLDPAGAAAGQADAVRNVVWSTPWWQWLIPFTAGTATYLVATALWVGAKRPLWWVGGIWICYLVFSVVAEEAGVAWITATFEAAYATLDTLFTGGTDSLRMGIRPPNEQWTRMWTAMPGAGRWVAMTGGWIAVGLVAAWGATKRHREA
jgi:hypothetical protein